MTNPSHELPVPTTEQVEKMFDALDDSLALINAEVDAETHSDDIDGRVWRNWKHIELMLEKDFIKNAGKDLTKYSDVVAKGKTFAPNSTKE